MSQIDKLLLEKALLLKQHDDGYIAAVEGTPEAARIAATNAKLREIDYEISRQPELNAVRCFMVDFIGQDPTAVLPTDRSVQEILDDADGDIQEIVTRMGGALAASVRQYLESLDGPKLSDSGGGCGHWHFGVICTPGEAWRLHHDSRVRFRKAIQARLLSINICAWSCHTLEEQP